MPKEETPVGKSSPKTRRSPKKRHSVDTKQEQVFKFLIGLRLLGEEKRERFLAYMRSFQASSENGQASSKKEGEHGT
jgi:hypothetical protein